MICTWASIRQTRQRGIYKGGCAGPTQTHCSHVSGVCGHKAPQELGIRKRSEGVLIIWRVKMQSSQVAVAAKGTPVNMDSCFFLFLY